VKIGIVVPFSWSFWGAVVEHAELQAAALEACGHEVRLVMGNDPPGQFTRALHPRVGRHGNPPGNVIPVGRSVIVPANGSLPNIVLSPRSIFRVRRVLERERFDVLHLHEPMTPAICIAVLALAIGIGANTAIFSVVNAVLLKPLPFPQPEQLVSFGSVDPREPRQNGFDSVSYPDFFDMRAQNKSFAHLAVFRRGSVALDVGDVWRATQPRLNSSSANPR
jgi:hypothetical protein